MKYRLRELGKHISIQILESVVWNLSGAVPVNLQSIKSLFDSIHVSFPENPFVQTGPSCRQS